MKKGILKLSVLTSIVICGISIRGISQQMNPSIKNISISSPNAASLGKYGDIPINYHTGVPGISIPIYTIKSGTLELPVSVSYHASGLKVQEQASNVGAGWTLNAGGMITRTVMGAPDDKGLQAAYTQKGHFTDYGYNSYLFSSGPVYCNPNPNGNGPFYCPVGRAGMPPSNYAPQDSYIQCGIFDGEPDLYFFNFKGYSGKFYFNDDRTPIIEPQQDIKITPIYPGNDWRGMIGFIIITPDGTKYYFGKNQNNDGNIDAVEVTYNISTQQQYNGQGATSSWYLNKIVSSDEQSVINLIYQPESISTYSTSMYPIPAVPNPNWWAYNNEYDLNKNFINAVRLSKITFSNGEVNFNPGSLRQDISKGLGPFPNYNYAGLSDMDNTDEILGARTLGDISIQTGSSLIKKYKFHTSYFYDSNPLTGKLFTQTYPGMFNLHTDQYRLRLDSIVEMAGDNVTSLPPYQFTYNTGVVPRKLSFGIDHWGFYNGVNTNTRLIPTYTIVPQGGQAGTSASAVTVVEGANRDASWPAMFGGALTQIKYPTGGITNFEFEPNSIYGVTSSYNNVTLSGMFLHMYGQGGNSTSSSFVVDGTTNSVNISMVSTCNYSCKLTIRNSNQAIVYETELGNWDGFTGTNVSFQNTINLPPGTYTGSLTLNYQANNGTVTGGVESTIKQWQHVTSNNSMIVGGLRIKKITNSSGIAAVNTETTYGYNYNNGVQSSATLYSVPVYVQGLRNDAWKAVNGLSCSAEGCFTCFGSNVSYYQSPSSIRPMATSQGNHIGYNEVFVSQSNNGYSKYKYYNNNGLISGPWSPLQTDVCQRVLNTFCDPNLVSSPAAPLKFEPMRGELANVSTYTQAGQLISNTAHYPLWQYDSLTTPGITSKFFVTGYQMSSSNTSSPGNMTDLELGMAPGSYQPVGIQTFTEYNLQSARKIRDSVVSETYDLISGNAIKEINTTYYGSKYHTSPTKTLAITSKGETLVSKYKNAFDFRISNFNLADELPAYYNNIASDNAYLNTAYATFNLSPSDPHYYWNRLYIYTNYRYMKAIDRQNYLASRINFTNSYNNAHNTAKLSANAELKPLFELQDKFNNPVIESALWKDTKLTNAAFNQYDYVGDLPDIVYPNKSKALNIGSPVNNFTPASVNNNSLAKDNRYADEIIAKYKNGNISEFTQKNGEIITYLWGYNQQYPVAKITGTTYDIAKNYITQSVLDNPGDDVTLRNHLNNLRSIPNTFVTTYTYKPLVGITSETDPRGRTTFYEYDGFNRLILIKDNEGKILKKICYNYAGQQENCAVNCTDFTANWQNTGNTRCQKDANNQNTGYTEYEQTNTNPCNSATTQWVVQGGQNTTTCPVPVMVNLTSTNTYNTVGYIASYYNTATGYTYVFNVPTGSGLQALGTVPAGNYTLTINRPNYGGLNTLFKSGCFKQTVTGTSATFYNVNVSTTTCNSITVTVDMQE